MSRIEIGRSDTQGNGRLLGYERSEGGQITIIKFEMTEEKHKSGLAEYGIELHRHDGQILSFGLNDECYRALIAAYYQFNEEDE